MWAKCVFDLRFLWVSYISVHIRYYLWGEESLIARLTKGVYGPVSGAMGPLMASTWKGQPYLKTRPRKRSKKRRVGEERNQDKFSQRSPVICNASSFVL
jgi:hypothetical protein